MFIDANYERKGLQILFVDERTASATRQSEEETDLGNNNTKRSYEKERSRWTTEEM